MVTTIGNLESMVSTATAAVTINASNDLDLDGILNGVDTDIDGDGWINSADVFPYSSLEWADTDNDGIGNNADLDDDGDGVSDINDDGNYDLFFGSASFSESRLYLGTDDGNFIENESSFKNDFIAEDVDAEFFDVDGDKDLDLYVVSAGNEFPYSAESLRDRLYIFENNQYKRKENLSRYFL